MTATSLHPFVPSGSHFALSLEFFAALGFQQVRRQDGVAGLRLGVCWHVRQNGC